MHLYTAYLQILLRLQFRSWRPTSGREQAEHKRTSTVEGALDEEVVIISTKWSLTSELESQGFLLLPVLQTEKIHKSIKSTTKLTLLHKQTKSKS